MQMFVPETEPVKIKKMLSKIGKKKCLVQNIIKCKYIYYLFTLLKKLQQFSYRYQEIFTQKIKVYLLK